MLCQQGGLPGACCKGVQSRYGGACKERAAQRALGSPSPKVLWGCGDAALRGEVDSGVGWGWTSGSGCFPTLNDSTCKDIEEELQVSRPWAPPMAEPKVTALSY